MLKLCQYKGHLQIRFSDGRIRNEQIVAAPFLGEYKLIIETGFNSGTDPLISISLKTDTEN